MRLVANLMAPDVPAGEWAAQREDEGWSGVSISDHYFGGSGQKTRWFPHLWVTAAETALSTSVMSVGSTFANNLIRSPVEFAQASLTMQRLSTGRWEAGLGAGWHRAELVASGQVYPPARERADRYIEAIQIARALLHDRGCQFHGTYYNINIAELEGFSDTAAPVIVGAVGGPRTIAGVSPHVDRVELKGIAAATRRGALDLDRLWAIPRKHLADLVIQVRQASPDVRIGFFAMCGVTSDPFARQIASGFDDASALYADLFGEPARVAAGLRALASFGIDCITVCPTDPEGFEALAPFLFEEAKARNERTGTSVGGTPP